MICQCLGGLPILVLALSMMSTIDEVLADLSIRLNPFLPTGALTDSMFRRRYRFFFQLSARVTAFNSSGSSEGFSPYNLYCVLW